MLIRRIVSHLPPRKPSPFPSAPQRPAPSTLPATDFSEPKKSRDLLPFRPRSLRFQSHSRRHRHLPGNINPALISIIDLWVAQATPLYRREGPLRRSGPKPLLRKPSNTQITARMKVPSRDAPVQKSPATPPSSPSPPTTPPKQSAGHHHPQTNQQQLETGLPPPSSTSPPAPQGTKKKPTQRINPRQKNSSPSPQQNRRRHRHRKIPLRQRSLPRNSGTAPLGRLQGKSTRATTQLTLPAPRP